MDDRNDYPQAIIVLQKKDSPSDFGRKMPPTGRTADAPKGLVLPNFFIIGANKGGTTSLAKYLDEHPQIFLSKPKEPHFFSRVDLASPQPSSTPVGQGGAMLKKYAHEAMGFTTLEEYATLFAEAPDHAVAIGEASTGYLANQQAAINIRHVRPEAKLIAVLRNPAERAFSNYKMYRKEGIETEEDFLKVLKRDSSHLYVTLGYYGRQLSRWMSLFPRDQVKIYLFEELAADPAAVCKDVFTFLGADANFMPQVGKKYNVSVSKENIPEDVRRYLVELYRQDILLLQDLLQRDLSTWLG